MGKNLTGKFLKSHAWNFVRQNVFSSELQIYSSTFQCKIFFQILFFVEMHTKRVPSPPIRYRIGGTHPNLSLEMICLETQLWTTNHVNNLENENFKKLNIDIVGKSDLNQHERPTKIVINFYQMNLLQLFQRFQFVFTVRSVLWTPGLQNSKNRWRKFDKVESSL